MAWQLSVKKFLKVAAAGLIAYGSSFVPVLNQFPQTPEIVLLTALYVAIYNYASYYGKPVPAPEGK